LSPAGIFTQARKITLPGLTPGQVYSVQSRAIGGSTGYSDWSDPISHMVIDHHGRAELPLRHRKPAAEHHRPTESRDEAIRSGFVFEALIRGMGLIRARLLGPHGSLSRKCGTNSFHRFQSGSNRVKGFCRWPVLASGAACLKFVGDEVTSLISISGFGQRLLTSSPTVCHNGWPPDVTQN
jgi:hypothetical protein